MGSVELQRPRMPAPDVLVAQASCLFPYPPNLCHTAYPPNFPFPVLLPLFPTVLPFLCGTSRLPRANPSPSSPQHPSLLSEGTELNWSVGFNILWLSLGKWEMEATGGIFKIKISIIFKRVRGRDIDNPYSSHFLPVKPTKGNSTQKWSCGWWILQDTQKNQKVNQTQELYGTLKPETVFSR